MRDKIIEIIILIDNQAVCEFLPILNLQQINKPQILRIKVTEPAEVQIFQIQAYLNDL
jgi:hypothetical protein